jgi:hypothetical protein
MTLINLLKPGLGELFGLTVLSLMGLVLAFMVMTMASGLESRAMVDLVIDPSASGASNGCASEPLGPLAMLSR